jgi:homogentisate 1,2-dioxygenase
MSQKPSPLTYLSGFGNEFATEAVPKTLPVGHNSPQNVAHGLYAEKFSGTAFTAPAVENLRSWFYRIRPSVVHGPWREIDCGLLRTGPCDEVGLSPDQLRWDPLPQPGDARDFVAGLTTMTTNGNASLQIGIGVHIYCINRPMHERYFCNADGEMLIVPEQGAITLYTECGILETEPGEVALLPRGMKFRVVPSEGNGYARGYVCENYGRQFRLPERGPIGSDGLANRRDFLAPVAAFEDRKGSFELVTKFAGKLFRCDIGHSPLDVVAWHGNLAPYKYDLARFNTIGSISFDHPDPSIFTVLTSPSDTPGMANADFVIFPPRWMVAENTFRPPWYHRNIMSEFMGLIHGEYDAKSGGGFAPGGSSLHNCMSAHGPDRDAYEKAVRATLKPQKLMDTLAFMFESRYMMRPTQFALQSPALQENYRDCWQDLPKNFAGDGGNEL